METRIWSLEELKEMTNDELGATAMQAVLGYYFLANPTGEFANLHHDNLPPMRFYSRIIPNGCRLVTKSSLYEEHPFNSMDATWGIINTIREYSRNENYWWEWKIKSQYDQWIVGIVAGHFAKEVVSTEDSNFVRAVCYTAILWKGHYSGN